MTTIQGNPYARYHHAIAAQVAVAQRSTVLQRTDTQGNPLYTVTSGGNLRRTRKISKATRRAVLDRDGHRCTECRTSYPLELHHVIRYADGGLNTPENLVTLCSGCHIKAGVA